MTKTVFLLFTLVWHDTLPASFIQPDAKQTNTQRDMDKTRLEVMKILQASTSITIILDIWLSKNMSGFIGFTCMCVNKEFERRMVFLGVKKMTERHTAENILAEYDQVLRDWNIPRSK